MEKFRNSKLPNINRKRIFTAQAAVIAAALVIVPTAVFAFSKINANVVKTPDDGNIMDNQPVSESDNNSSDDENMTVSGYSVGTCVTGSQTVSALTTQTNASSAGAAGTDNSNAANDYMMYKLNYVPSGYSFMGNDSAYSNKYRNDSNDGAITPVFYRIPAEGDFMVDTANTVSRKDYSSNGKTVEIYYREGYNKGASNNFNRDIWIFFDNTRYLLELCITDDISSNDMYNIIDNVSLYPTNEKLFGEYFSWLEDDMQADSNTDSSINYGRAYDIDRNFAMHTGDTAFHSVPDYLGYYSFRVNSAEITDTVAGITADNFGVEGKNTFSWLMDENGKIKSNTRTWFEYPDWTTLYTEDMPYHILKINATITNPGNDEYLLPLSPQVFSFDENNHAVWYEVGDKMHPGFPESVGFKDSISGLDGANCFSISACGRDNSEVFVTQNNGVNIKLAGNESVDVDMYCFVTENRIGNMYFSSTFGDLLTCVNDSENFFDFSDLRP